jgi:DNA helicase-2/ATP-dependent DNA helicase PcrA
MLNSKLLDDLEKNFELLLHARKKPYFARMDIKEQDKDYFEALYIGKVSLFDSSMDTPLVIDWRAPVASVYYEGRLGQTTYQVEDMTHNIELSLKRQYTFEAGELVDFMDVDISTSDTFLQASLESHAGDKLKDIVSTIQGEQNQIIRSDINSPLIVQGVAGSGKTTIALHRIAYLIYTYAASFRPEDFMIIAPNTLFLDYISGVLPELGANKVIQTTYVDLMFGWIGKKLKLSNSNEKLNTLIRTDDQAPTTLEKYLIEKSAAFKNSMKMKELLDLYIQTIQEKVLPKEDLYLEDFLITSHQEIKRHFEESYNYLPIFERVDRIKKYLTPLVKNQSKEILDKVDQNYTKALDHIRSTEEDTESRRLKLVALMKERDQGLELIKKQSKTLVKKYMSKFFSMGLLDLYADFLSHLDQLLPSKAHVQIFKYIQQTKGYELEDLAAITYLKNHTFGMDQGSDVKMVVIDEAQDFSNFQFHVLREILKTERFTILGDLSQGIHMYRSIENWDYLKTNIFKKETSFLTLEQSYRTTIEIMKEANFVLNHMPMDNLIEAKPVVRHGKKPNYENLKNSTSVIKKILETIETWTMEKYTTLAVITKSNQEAKKVYKHLHKLQPQLNMSLVDEKTEHFDHRILVIPAHLAKGLEFDGVIITALEDTFKKNPLDIKLMYVAMTRAMHRLSIISHDNLMTYYHEERKTNVS